MMGLEGVAMTALMTAETPSGAGTTMTLSGSLFNLGAAGGSAIGGALLALSGTRRWRLLAVLALAAALLSWWPDEVVLDGPSLRKAGLRSRIGRQFPI